MKRQKKKSRKMRYRLSALLIAGCLCVGGCFPAAAAENEQTTEAAASSQVETAADRIMDADDVSSVETAADSAVGNGAKTAVDAETGKDAASVTDTESKAAVNTAQDDQVIDQASLQETKSRDAGSKSGDGDTGSKAAGSSDNGNGSGADDGSGSDQPGDDPGTNPDQPGPDDPIPDDPTPDDPAPDKPAADDKEQTPQIPAKGFYVLPVTEETDPSKQVFAVYYDGVLLKDTAVLVHISKEAVTETVPADPGEGENETPADPAGEEPGSGAFTDPADGSGDSGTDADDGDTVTTVTKEVTVGEVLDPAKASAYPDAVILSIDKNGTAKRYQATAILSFFWQGSQADYYVKNGRIAYADVISYAAVNGIFYEISMLGTPSVYSGFYANAYYVDGKALKNQNILVNRIMAVPKTTYQIVSPYDSAKYPNAVIYQIDADGKAAVYTKTALMAITYKGSAKLWYVVNGKIRTASGKSYLKAGGYLYQIKSNGRAVKYNGVRKNTFYRNGKKKKYTFVLYKKYLYRTTKSGKLKKYFWHSAPKKYYVTAYKPNGKLYCVKVNKKTARAKVWIKDKKRAGTYKKFISGLLYKVSRNTGEAVIYTGAYKGNYYVSGRARSGSSHYYGIDGNQVYRISKKGKKTLLYMLDKTNQRTKYVSSALAYFGINEQDGTHKPIIDIFNSSKKATRYYRMTYWDSWCATFVSAVYIKNKMSKIAALECSCGRQIDLWKKKGRWIEKDSYVPKTGDLIYYDWDDSGRGNCTGWPEHVGIVIGVNNGKIIVLEGNYYDAVGIREIKVNGRFIRGFAKPKYS